MRRSASRPQWQWRMIGTTTQLCSCRRRIRDSSESINSSKKISSCLMQSFQCEASFLYWDRGAAGPSCSHALVSAHVQGIRRGNRKVSMRWPRLNDSNLWLFFAVLWKVISEFQIIYIWILVCVISWPKQFQIRPPPHNRQLDLHQYKEGWERDWRRVR